MPRYREYDPEKVIDRTIGLILRKGYFATSIDDLIAETGLNKHSLYAHYGNKRGLFLAALEQYKDSVLGPIVAPLSTSDAGVAQIQETFDTLARWAQGPEGHMGCLVCSAASDIAPMDPEIGAVVIEIFDGLKDAFARALANAEGRRTRDVSTKANYLLGVFQGYMAIIKGPLPSRTADDYLKLSLAILEEDV